MSRYIDMRSAAEVTAYMQKHVGRTVIFTTDARAVPATIESAADVVVQVDLDGIGTIIKERASDAPPPPFDYDLCRGWRGLSGSWGRTGAARIRPTFLGYALEEEYQSPDGERRWVKTDDPITIRERKQR